MKLVTGIINRSCYIKLFFHFNIPFNAHIYIEYYTKIILQFNSFNKKSSLKKKKVCSFRPYAFYCRSLSLTALLSSHNMTTERRRNTWLAATTLLSATLARTPAIPATLAITPAGATISGSG
jgi:hypothetical protein